MNNIIEHASSHSAPTRSGVWRASIGLAITSLLGFGFVYSLAVTNLGNLMFPAAASGSLIERDGKVVGSSLVAQPFADDRYFQSRPSAASYDVMALAGSNQARTNPDLRTRVDEARAAVAARDGVAPEAVPSDLVTQSGGGIDPHISPQAAQIQVQRVAKARGMQAADVQALLAKHTEGMRFGLYGAPHVNVLELNLALDQVAPAPTRN
ncbi:potassium-transporting ATPase subunit KdpC [Stenotrophomonas sp. YAU14A_MKIMI4_1]|uniref:potassium-transporting ATPase subunit KdpC n=1 Tax=Stenotrophomonas sp. YAU14A_MKIMI4_1 TaxID=2072408 RepID=UPI000D5426E4|nr:potassium-transporting ATPase subunit KdpC [Stenotrophomonas sp. YAU14A_MKIMI4_1]AWH30560.1 potassium-transporting ATPase subunit C [Stenotrophomonas sp. YAU14A_MKIMI4_1]